MKRSSPPFPGSVGAAVLCLSALLAIVAVSFSFPVMVQGTAIPESSGAAGHRPGAPRVSSGAAGAGTACNIAAGTSLARSYCVYIVLALGIAGIILLTRETLPRVSLLSYAALLTLASCLCWLIFDFCLLATGTVNPGAVLPLLCLAGVYTAVSLVVGNWRLRKERSLARGLRSIREHMASGADIDSLAPTILDALIGFTGARRGAVLIHSGRGPAGCNGDWELKASRGTEGMVRDGKWLEPYEKVIAAVRRNREPLFVAKGAWRKFGLARNRAGYRPSFLLCLPLIARGRLVGLTYVDGKTAASHMTSMAAPIIRSIAGRLGAAVENSILCSEVEAARDREAESVVREAAGTSPRDLCFEGMTGSSSAMRRVLDLVEKAAGGDITVLIQGETGTGKELVARAIHVNGPRRERSFIAHNCAALPESLLESELFGYTKGAFTGAVADRNGLIVSADGGSFFLDEVTECSPGVQAKLLRVLQDGIVRRLGDATGTRVNVRIIAATNRDLHNEVIRGCFRKDLYYRLNVFPITIPPLRERAEDIPELARHFLKRYAARARKNIEGFTKGAMSRLVAYRFPGNVRELENEIERVVALHQRGRLIMAVELSRRFTARAGGAVGRGLPWNGETLKDVILEFEKETINSALDSCDLNITRAAKRLGLSRYGLYKKMTRHGIFCDIGDRRGPHCRNS